MRDGAREGDGVSLIEKVDLIREPDLQSAFQDHAPLFASMRNRLRPHGRTDVVARVDRLELLSAVRRKQRKRDSRALGWLPQRSARVCADHSTWLLFRRREEVDQCRVKGSGETLQNRNRGLDQTSLHFTD